LSFELRFSCAWFRNLGRSNDVSGPWFKVSAGLARDNAQHLNLNSIQTQPSPNESSMEAAGISLSALALFVQCLQFYKLFSTAHYLDSDLWVLRTKFPIEETRLAQEL
jgi:hypothetical protein